MTDVQKAWILSWVVMAQELCPENWRVALAVAAHESNCGTSDLAVNHNNLFGIKAVPELVRAGAHRTATDGVHREFDEKEDGFVEFNRMLTRSVYYPYVREVERRDDVLEARHRSKGDAAVVLMLYPNYCPMPSWVNLALDWLDGVWELTRDIRGPEDK